MKFFSYESRFSQILLKLCYACYLNLLWFVCSIPVFTIGAATTALYYASLKVVRDEDSHVGAMFFRSFRENFRQATQIWLILLGVGLFLGADGYILYHLRTRKIYKVVYKDNYNGAAMCEALEGDRDHSVKHALRDEPPVDVREAIDKLLKEKY